MHGRGQREKCMQEIIMDMNNVCDLHDIPRLHLPIFDCTIAVELFFT
jgi:hypothetical protein